MKKFGLLLTIFCFAAMPAVVFAQDSYRAEAGAGYITSEDDSNIEMNMPIVFATFHFDEVNTSGHPLAEAAFLERIGSIGFMLGEGDIEGSVNGDVSYLVADLTYMKPDTPYFAEVTLFKTEIEVPGQTIDVDDIALEAGMFLADTLRVSLTYFTGETETFGQTMDSDGFGANVKFVKKHENGKACNLEGRVERTSNEFASLDESNTIISLLADHYFNEKTNIELGYTINSGDDKDVEGDTLSLGVRHFFTPKFYGELYYDKFSADDATTDDEDEWLVAVSARF